MFAARTLPTRDIVPAVETTPLMLDVDDPAIWIDPQNHANSLIVGTVKRAKPEGVLTVYNLNGEILETAGRSRSAEQRRHLGQYRGYDRAGCEATWQPRRNRSLTIAAQLT